MTVKSYTEFTFDPERSIIRSRKKHGGLYFEDFATFDIEVTNYHRDDLRVGIPYLWTFATSKDEIYYGRTLEEFTAFLNEWAFRIEALPDPATQVIYVHNLAYEFQFLRRLIPFDDVFLVDIRKPLYAKYRCFEFRCSYLLSNMSLDNFLKNNDCEILKLCYDYRVERFPWEPLSKEDLTYCVHDTAGLWEALSKVYYNERVNVTTVPLTSTAFVRRDIKEAQGQKVRSQVQRLSRISPDLYQAMNGAFVGGNTHANKMYVDKIVENVYCYDIASSYPYCQITADYPVEPFREKKTGLDDLALDPHFAYLLLCRFNSITLTDFFDGMPNISKSKTLELSGADTDNGRILGAASLTMWLTDIEYHILERHYTWQDVTYLKVYYSRYGPLPDCVKACIFKYFQQKTTLKTDDPYLYRKAKEKLNSIYGMAAFNVGKRRFTYDNGYLKDERPLSDILDDLFGSTTMAEPYAWGVWTTARARENLDEVIRLAGDRFLYCDTDSVYCVGELDLTEINRRIMEKSAPYKVTYGGKDYYLGRWEVDKECSRFISLGAKKYAYEDKDGVHTVTAGVSKKAGVEKIEDYKIGHIFKEATNNAWYTDEDIDLVIRGHAIRIPSSIYIESADYTLGVTGTYWALLDYISNMEAISASYI